MSHVAGHGSVHVHADGARHIHRGRKAEGGKHIHRDGTAHDHATGVHTHKDGTAHQHEVKKDKKSKLGLDEMNCCAPKAEKADKAACCPCCGSAKCCCAKMDGAVPASRPAAPAANDDAQVQSLPGAGGTAAPVTPFQIVDFQPLLTWLQRYF